MSFLDDLVGAASAPECIDASDFSAQRGAGLDVVLATLGAVFPEPLFIVDENDSLLWMNLAMADRICRDNALEPDFAVEWLLSQLFAQEEDELVRDGYHVIDGAPPVRMIALADVLGRPEWLSVQVCEIPHQGQIYRLVILQDVTAIQGAALALQEENAMLSHALRHDLTTGLASRAHFIEALTAHRRDQPLAVIAVQIADFRAMKAKHGATAASRVAERLALEFVDLIEDDMLLARLAEDRLAVLIPGETRAEHVAEKANSMAAALCSDHHLPSGTWSVRLKAVCAVAGDPLTPQDMLDEIEASLTESPAPLGDSLLTLQVEEGARATKRKRDAHLTNALQAALDGDQIEAFLQPAVSCETGEIVFVEAVARWRHPENGLIPPSLFLRAAEDAGLGPAVDFAVAKSACAAAARWTSRGDRLRLSLNLFPSVLGDQAARAQLCELVRNHRIDPSSMIVECSLPTTSDPNALVRLDGIASLRADGFGFALDDAGWHHSDTVELFGCPPDFVKVSPKAVVALAALSANPAGAQGARADSARVQALQHYLSAAQALGAELVAVGVQDAQMMRAIAQIGFSHVQGHLIARPMAASSFERWLEGCARDAAGTCRAQAKPPQPV